MNLRDLKYFIALAETRHFGRAAGRTFVSQPTLSGQIRKLEAELGVALFERTTKAVALTPLGDALLPHARRAVEEADALSQQTMDICRMADRKDAIEALAEVIVSNLPNTVRVPGR